jgi:ATP-dependent DNA helicase DinG
VVESTFNYARRTLVYIPKNLPSPAAPDFSESIVEEVEKILNHLPWLILVQGETSRVVTLAKFSYRTESVLFATYNFWQDMDVLGESLTVVIIGKLSFPRPDRPLIQVRSALFIEEGCNFFLIVLSLESLSPLNRASVALCVAD